VYDVDSPLQAEIKSRKAPKAKVLKRLRLIATSI